MHFSSDGKWMWSFSWKSGVGVGGAPAQVHHGWHQMYTASGPLVPTPVSV